VTLGEHTLVIQWGHTVVLALAALVLLKLVFVMSSDRQPPIGHKSYTLVVKSQMFKTKTLKTSLKTSRDQDSSLENHNCDIISYHIMNVSKVYQINNSY